MTDLPRSTQTGRGQLSGPAPVARQARSITVRIEQIAPGTLQLSTPFGWRSGLARTSHELVRLVASAFTEAQVKAYSDWHNHHYDSGSQPGRTRRRPHRVRTDVHDPRQWRVDEKSGKWVSPSGRMWRADSASVQRVQAKLARMMLPPKTISDRD